MTSPIRPVVQLPKPLPVIKPAPKPVELKRPDELSTGQGRALRAASERKLAAPPFSATATPTLANSFRIGPGGTSFLRPLDESTGPSGPAPVSQAKLDQAKGILGDTPPNPTALANALRDAKDDPELRRALIKEAFADGAAPDWLEGQLFTDSRKGQVNEGYDDLTEVASAVQEAWQSGDITSSDLSSLAKDLGPDRTAVLVQTLALGDNATGNTQVVEALGEQAQSLGYDDAAALAFTSNPTLIDAHYPTADAQKEAFGHVQHFIEELDDDNLDILERNPAFRIALEGAVTDAARLTANGNGYTDQQMDDELKELGPTMSGELIAQAGKDLYNNSVPGPLDVLGDSATRLAGQTDGDDQKSWKVNAAIAYTQSDELMQANLDTPDKQEDAFKTLNQYMAENRGEWNLANRDGYSLLRLPQAVEGINRLLSDYPEMITKMLDGGPEGEADLAQLFESVSLNPDMDPQLRNQLKDTLTTYEKDQLGSVDEGNANEVSARVAKLYGIAQVAANRSVDHAEASDDAVKETALDFVAGLSGAATEAALLTVTGPLGAGVGLVVVDKTLSAIFGSGDKPSKDEIEEAFVAQLKAQGIDVSAGEAAHDSFTNVLGKLEDALTLQISKTTDPEQRAQLQTQLNVVHNMADGMDKFGDTIDSGQDAGQINTVLNDRHDDP